MPETERSDKDLFRYERKPQTFNQLFEDVFPLYDHSGYNEEEKLAMVWACALFGRQVMTKSTIASGVLLKASLNRAIRDKKAREVSSDG